MDIFDNKKKTGKGSGHNEHHEKVKRKTLGGKGHNVRKNTQMASLFLMFTAGF